jgi:transposase
VVLVEYTDSTVEIFYKNRRIAFHKKDRTPNGYTTAKDHMPSAHRIYSVWNPHRLIRWARTLGDHVETVVSHILAHRRHPEQGYKVCLGILNLYKTYDNHRLNKACDKAIWFQRYSYKGIKIS